MTICIAENYGGKGGIGGGAGAQGQASQNATGAAAHGYGYPIIEMVTGMTRTFDIQLTKDFDAVIPSDLSTIDRVLFVARPTMRGGEQREIRVPCEFTADGKVTLTLTPKEVDFNEGTWYAEFLCYEPDGRLTHDYRSYLNIRKGTRGSRGRNHPPTVLDVRMALCDTSPACNELLDDLEFSDVMILNAIERAIDEWEETPPRLSRHFDATTFPFREHLIKGAVGYLIEAIMYKYMRNRMQYSASGLTFDKNDKGQVYLQLAGMARHEWKAFVAAMKTSMNMEECFGVVEMPWYN